MRLKTAYFVAILTGRVGGGGGMKNVLSYSKGGGARQRRSENRWLMVTTQVKNLTLNLVLWCCLLSVGTVDFLKHGQQGKGPGWGCK